MMPEITGTSHACELGAPALRASASERARGETARRARRREQRGERTIKATMRRSWRALANTRARGPPHKRNAGEPSRRLGVADVRLGAADCDRGAIGRAGEAANAGRRSRPPRIGSKGGGRVM